MALAAISLLAALLMLRGVPHYHADVVYVLLLFVYLVLGFFGSIFLRQLFLPFVAASVFWITFYLVNSMKYGFSTDGFINHLNGLVWIGVATIPTQFISIFVRKSISEKKD